MKKQLTLKERRGKKLFTIKIGKQRFNICRGKNRDWIFGLISVLVGSAITSSIMMVTGFNNYWFFVVGTLVFSLIIQFKFYDLWAGGTRWK